MRKITKKFRTGKFYLLKRNNSESREVKELFDKYDLPLFCSEVIETQMLVDVEGKVVPHFKLRIVKDIKNMVAETWFFKSPLNFIEYTPREYKKLSEKIKNKVFFGIEIETNFNSEKIDFEVGDYHNGIELNDFWETQRDSSIYTTNEKYKRGIEFVSKKLEGIKEFEKATADFKQLFNGNKEELNDYIEFNKSCGCHIHIGFNKNKKVMDKIDFSKLNEMRKIFFKLVKESEVLEEITKEQILKQYFRNYAQKINKKSWLNGRGRSKEFNLDRREVKGFEWRSFNLCGVQSWAEFEEMFKIAKECLTILATARLNGYEGKKTAFRIGNKALKKFIDDENKTAIFEIPNGEKETILTDIKETEILKCDFIKEKLEVLVNPLI